MIFGVSTALPPLEYPRLKAPRADGELLLWPSGRAAAAATLTNSAALRREETVRFAGVPLGRVRSWQRKWLGHASERPLVATGHQAELYHPGVWVKNCVVDALARRLGGAALHLSVDTDTPKHLDFRYPGASLPLTDPRPAPRWSGLLLPPSPGHIRELQAAAAQLSQRWEFAPVADTFLETLGRVSSGADDLPSALANAHHQVDRELGLRHDSLVASPLWLSTGYLVFVLDLLARAESFAAAYNAALADFRAQQGIHSRGRPMPDLQIEPDTCEAPFWLDFLADGARKRAIVVRSENVWQLRALGDAFDLQVGRDGWAAAESLQAWLKARKLRLAPRALMLTLFLRLCVVDQFVHGIGGGLYDQVTDRIMANWYRLRPPAFSVATATLLFPPAAQRTPICLACLRAKGRELRHAALGPRKRELITRIEASPRNSLQRRQLFSQLHQELAVAAASSPALAQWHTDYQAAQLQHDGEQGLFDRELPYIMQPAHRLEHLLQTVDERTSQ
jgi:hypothetical protein